MSEPTTAEHEKRLQEITARSDAATEGPWRTFTTSWAPEHLGVERDGGDEEMIFWDAGGGITVAAPEDATFIAHARDDIPELLRRTLDAEQEVARLAALLTERDAVIRAVCEVLDEADSYPSTQADGDHVPVYLVRAALDAHQRPEDVPAPELIPGTRAALDRLTIRP